MPAESIEAAKPPSPPHATSDTSASTGHPKRWLILAIVLVAEVMDLIDATIVNVAAPSIRRDLGGSQTTLQWLGAAYTLAFAVLLITGGRLGDLVGRRRLFLVGIVGFTVASAGCAAAPSAGALIAIRAIQGGFGALLIPQGFGVIKEVFAEAELQKAFAAFGPVIGLSAVAAPIVGGALTGSDILGLHWRTIFLVNVPLGIVGLIGSIRLMPRTGGIPGTRLDPIGAVIVSLASFALIYPLVQGRTLGWPAWVFVLLAAGVAGFGLFALYERRHAARALITPSLLRNSTFTSGLLVALCFFAAMIGLNLVLSVFCQLGEGFSPLRTGLTLAPFAFGVVLTAGPSFPLAKRFGRTSLQVGLVVMAGGFALLAVMVSGSHAPVISAWTLVPGEAVAGMGMGLSLPPLFDFILAGVKGHEVGSASGVLNAVQQLAGTLGIAIFATIFFAYFDGHHSPASSAVSTIWLSLIPLAFAISRPSSGSPMSATGRARSSGRTRADRRPRGNVPARPRLAYLGPDEQPAGRRDRVPGPVRAGVPGGRRPAVPRPGPAARIRRAHDRDDHLAVPRQALGGRLGGAHLGRRRRHDPLPHPDRRRGPRQLRAARRRGSGAPRRPRPDPVRPGRPAADADRHVARPRRSDGRLAARARDRDRADRRRHRGGRAGSHRNLM